MKNMNRERSLAEVKATLETKPKVKLVGTDGNIFALTGKCSQALRSAGQSEKAKEMAGKVFASKSYHEALAILCEYVEVS
jgi:hypothetical protein